MAISRGDVPAVVRELMDIRAMDMVRLERLNNATRPDERRRIDWLPADTPSEIRRISDISKVNFLPLIVKSAVQSLFVDGFRVPGVEGELPVWSDGWQMNRMDRRQIGIHTAAVKYGVGYSMVLPGDDSPVITTASPMSLVTAYTEDEDDWPEYGLQIRKNGRMRLIDDTNVYDVQTNSAAEYAVVDESKHNIGVCPIIRYRPDEDLDNPVLGVVEPNLIKQQQIDFTTFGLLVAQHYGAFRQRYIIGWLAESEELRIKASASKFLTFEDAPDDIKVGEFGATDTRPYIESREASIRYLSAISQTPAHELLGQLVNLSAEALAAAQDSRNRLAGVMRTCLGESHEQMLTLVSELGGMGDVPPESYVWWRDTEPRSLAQVSDALGKLSQMLGIPQEALWEKVPGVSLQEVTRWKELKAAEPAPEPEPDPAPVPPVPAV